MNQYRSNQHTSIDPVERFWSKVDKDGPLLCPFGPCWEWTASLTPITSNGLGGYGRFSTATAKSGWMTAPRFAWGMAPNGVPKGMTICHVCDYPRCVRNDDIGVYVLNGVEYERRGHLFLATTQVNSWDMVVKRRQGFQQHPESIRRGEDAKSRKLTSEQVQAIRQRFASGGITKGSLAVEFQVTRATIGQIIRGNTWGHLNAVDRWAAQVQNAIEARAKANQARLAALEALRIALVTDADASRLEQEVS